MHRIFFRDANLFIYVYDASDRESFEKIQEWMTKVADFRQGDEESKKYLVATKVDLEE